MNKKGKYFIFYNKPYMPSAALRGPFHKAMMCALKSVPASALELGLHAHTVVLPAAA